MPQLMPFRGLRYTAAAGQLSDLLAPPYDVIGPAQKLALEARSPYNAIHLEFSGAGADPYASVAERLRDWEQRGVVARDAAPTLYVYEQHFAERGVRYTRRALLTAVEAQPWDEGAVKPHEFTMSGPKEDRLNLLKATQTQFSPVFMIARDRAGQLASFLESTIAERPPDLVGMTGDGEEHRLWLVEAGRYEMRQLAPLLAESFYIADGHHRYETAVNYRDWLAAQHPLERDHPARFTMTAVVPASDRGLVIRPIHRVVPRQAPTDWESRLAANFTIDLVKPVGDGPARIAELEMLLVDEPGAAIAIGLDGPGLHLLTPRGAVPGPGGHSDAWASIPPNVLRYGVLEPLWGITDDDLRLGAVEYNHDASEVISQVEAHPRMVGFLLNPVSVDSVMALADGGERMPQKSTFFHPKLGTGLVFNPLQP
jgi:uncharacterized protein (DUF1015 family)